MSQDPPIATASVAATGMCLIWLTDIEPILKAVASVVTIFSALAAGIYYSILTWYKIQEARQVIKDTR